MRKMIALLLTLALCLSLYGCGATSAPAEETVEATTVATTEAPTEPTISQEEIAVAYHESMAAALAQELETAPVANLAVAYVEYAGNAAKEEHDPPTYTKQYVPSEYVAETPEEVCFIIRCTHNANVAGYYGLAGAPVGTDAAFRRYLNVAIEDRFTGKILQEAEFEGGDPAEVINSGDSHYGSYPDEKEVSAWLEGALKEANEARLVSAVEYAKRTVATYHPSQEHLIKFMTKYGGAKYSMPEAEYAVENCGADWNECALLLLQEELADPDSIANEYYYRSYEGAVSYLVEIEEFTEEQARYAADNIDADWNK